MHEIGSKSTLGIVLSQLKGFSEHNLKLEQYPTPSEIVAEVVWNATLKGHIAGKVILDPGCGNGIFGFAALLMGARKVFFVDVDKYSIQLTKENDHTLDEIYELGERDFIVDRIENFNHKVDCVLQNPPFGTKEKHADKLFLETAFRESNVIYTMHKLSTVKFVESIAKDNSFGATLMDKIDFPINAVHHFHRKKKYNVEVGIWLLER